MFPNTPAAMADAIAATTVGASTANSAGVVTADTAAWEITARSSDRKSSRRFVANGPRSCA